VVEYSSPMIETLVRQVRLLVALQGPTWRLEQGDTCGQT
jgi:hypothetical protein